MQQQQHTIITNIYIAIPLLNIVLYIQTSARDYALW